MTVRDISDVTSIIAAPPRLIVPVTARRKPIRIALILQAAMLPLAVGNLLRISIGSTNAGDRAVPLLLNDIAAVFIVAVGIAACALNRRLRVDSVILIALTFATVGGLETIVGISRFGYTTSDVIVALAFLARWLLYFAIYVVVVNAVRSYDVLPVWRTLENITVAFSIFGLFQSAFIPDFAQKYYPESVPGVDWDVQGHRLVSSYLDPNFAGALIVMALAVHIGMLAAGADVKRWKTLIFLGALIATLSRSAILAFVLVLGIVIFIRGLSKRVLGLVLGAIVAMLAAAPALIRFAAMYNKTSLSDPSALARLVSWIHLWTVFSEHPFFGIGFNAWSVTARQHGWLTVPGVALGNEGGLFFVAALTGIVGLSIFVAMLVAMTVRARRVWRDPMRAPHERGISMAVPAIIVAMVFHSLFTNSLFLPLLMEPMWIILGLGFVVANEPLGQVTA